MAHLKGSSAEIEIMLTKNSDKESQKNCNKLKPIADMVILEMIEMILNTIQMLENIQVVVWVTV